MNLRHRDIFGLIIGGVLCSSFVLAVQASQTHAKNPSKDSLSHCRDRVWLESKSRSESSLAGITKVSLMISEDAFPRNSGIDIGRLKAEITQKCIEKGINVVSNGEDPRTSPVLTVSINSMTSGIEAKEVVNVLHLRLLEHILLARDMKSRDVAPTFQYESLVSIGRHYQPDSDVLEKNIFNALDFFLTQWKQQNKQ